MKIYPHPSHEDAMQVSSASDCTGLIPAGTTDEQEMEMYEELYDFLPEPAKKQNKPHME